MILLMGALGAGKSEQGHRLAERYGFAYISTGELFRLFLSRKRKAEINAGKLVGDQETIQLVDKVLDIIDTDEQFILDGFPRTDVQADWLVAQAQAGRFAMPEVIYLDIDEAEVRTRLSKRGRADDTQEVITTRYRLYLSQTAPLLNRLSERGMNVHTVSALGTPEDVEARIAEQLQLGNS